jgi:two-component system response regulator PilR (NtrC family)
MALHKKEMRVLVADDDQAIRQLVCTIVKREGLEVDCAADGAEAIEMLREHRYAVLLIDLMMPRVDGFGVIEYVKNHPAPQKPVILVITAYADQKFKEVDPNIVTGIVRKPFEVADLGNVVRLCVEGYEDAVPTESFEETKRNWHIPQGMTAGTGNGDGAH